MASAPQIYSREYYQRIRDFEDEHWWYVGTRAIALSLLRSHAERAGGWRVLDAGCGTGASLVWARGVLRAGSITGVDISRSALAFCRGRGERALSQSSITHLPFGDRCFDLVLCNDVLHPLPPGAGCPAPSGPIPTFSSTRWRRSRPVSKRRASTCGEPRT